MISIIVLVRDVRDLAANCLQSLLVSLRMLGLERASEYILADDCSNKERGVVELFQQFRTATPMPVKIMHFKTPQHYGRALAYAMSVAKGDQILFFSHDMLITPQCIRMLLAVAATDQRMGIVRPVSQHMDGADRVAVRPPFQLMFGDQLNAFATTVAYRHGLGVAVPSALIGDAMLIRRDVMERIGVFDPRFPGFLADIDYGVRARRAGFNHVIALGAWLHHLGKGLMRDSAGQVPGKAEAIHAENVAMLDRSWAIFREKWGAHRVPERFSESGDRELAMLAQSDATDTSVNDHQPPITPAPQDCEML